MNKLSISDLDVKGKKLFLRVDYNVPLNEALEISDASRIELTIPTIKFLCERGARVCLVSHLGRPTKKKEADFSLQPVAKYLSSKHGLNLRFCTDIVGESADQALAAIKDGEAMLFENIRYYPEEEANSPEFCKIVAQKFDLYASDAFATAHRAHASTAGIPRHFKNAAAGFLLEREIEFLSTLTANPKRPFCAILGGAKVKDKLKVIDKLLDVADEILIGGGMAYTFLKVQGQEIGNSLFDEASSKIVEKLLSKAEKLNKKILLPIDHLQAESIDGDARVTNRISAGSSAFDIGPLTIELYSKVIAGAAQVFWNGPLGVFEKKNFSNGTFAIAKALNDCKAITVVGGGDSVSALYKSGYQDNISHISTGGGASLEFLEGTSLPGIEVLADKPN